MTRTLADMTPEERAACVGRWATYHGSTSPRPVIIWAVEDNTVWRLSPWRRPRVQSADLDQITPRFDLPRAWTPDGKPVSGEWADGHMWWGEDADTMQTVDLVGAECLATGQVQGLGEWPEGVTPGEDVPVRRFITDWEEA